VTNKDELRLKILEIKQKYRQLSLVEEFIEGREINAAILCREVLPLSEIVFSLAKGEPTILTYDAKWDEASAAYAGTVGRCPIDIDKGTEEQIRKISLKVYDAFFCTGYARVDFRIKEGIAYVIDVNPNPCINPHGAGFVRSAKAAGYDYERMIRRIIECAMQRNINTI